MQMLSVIVPCRNERDHIESFCTNALAQTLPEGWTLEVVIADGESDDGTREVIDRIALGDARVRVIDNPRRIVSCGLNAALAAARGAAVVRMDVHTRYAPDYVSQCLDVLQRTGADNVGGPWRAEPAEAGAGWPAAIAAVFQSRWVAGGARSRSLTYEGEVDTVYLGCWPRASFDRFGGFDESLVRNQDDEHNLRIVLGGGRVWQSPSIRSVYQPRGSLRDLAAQWLQYGYWKPFVMRKHGQAASWRHRVPALFVAAVLLSAVGAVLGSGAVPLVGLCASYALAVLALSITIALEGKGSVSWRDAWRWPLVVATQQLAYGIGTLIGWWDARRPGAGRERFSSLTR
jgi:glycosyltransferase involved in cell wall biosynthesis